MFYRSLVGFVIQDPPDPITMLESQHEFLPPEAFITEGLPPEIHQYLPSTIDPHNSIETLMGTIRLLSQEYVARKRKNRNATLEHLSLNITIGFNRLIDGKLIFCSDSDESPNSITNTLISYTRYYINVAHFLGEPPT